mmetsp:Transcript_58902/g.149223  ORF Transcript_58902/g.149223 Transcript_58902/m.149223 type:complete len:276 (-) Transcript_58902:336-1163(-)
MPSCGVHEGVQPDQALPLQGLWRRGFEGRGEDEGVAQGAPAQRLDPEACIPPPPGTTAALAVIAGAVEGPRSIHAFHPLVREFLPHALLLLSKLRSCLVGGGGVVMGGRELRGRGEQGAGLVEFQNPHRRHPRPGRHRAPRRQKVEQEGHQRQDHLHDHCGIEQHESNTPEFTMVLAEKPWQRQVQMKLGHSNEAVEHGQIHLADLHDAFPALHAENDESLETTSSPDSCSRHDEQHDDAKVLYFGIVNRQHVSSENPDADQSEQDHPTCIGQNR